MKAKKISIQTPQQEKEARLVAGVCANDKRAQSEMYRYCSDYFWTKYRGVFFADENAAMEIFQNTFIVLWEKIERRKIYVSDGWIMGMNDEPFSGSILTYFMKVAINKHKEWVRSHPHSEDPEMAAEKKVKEEGADAEQCIEMLYDPVENTMLDIVSDVISNMSERCSQVLSKFYYERKDLDTILAEIPTINSKDALKNRKHQCLDLLRKTARNIYNEYLNKD